MRQTVLLIVGLGIPVCSLIAAKPDLAKLPPPSDKTELTYVKDVRPILEASCFGCHGEERHRGGLRLDSLQGILKGSDDGPVVKAGKSEESLLVVAVAQIDDETAMPPKRQRGGGMGGGGGRGGFGPANFVAPQMFAQADTDKDQKLTKSEFSALADKWFDKLDTAQTAKVTREQFTEKFNELVPLQEGFGGRRDRAPEGEGGPQRRPGNGPGTFIAPGLFAAMDANKDDTLTRSELKSAFEKWFTEWDSTKSGALTEEQFRTGLSAALPRPEFGGFAGGGARGGGPGGFGGFGRGVLAQKMLAQADADKDQKLTKGEFASLANTWFDKLDARNTGKLTPKEFSEKFADIMDLQQPAGGGQGRGGEGERPRGFGGGPGQGGGPAQTMALGLFNAADANKDGSLDRAELKSAFERWFGEWDSDKSGTLNQEKLYAGLSAVLPRPNFGGGGGVGGAGGPGGPGGFGGGQGPAPKPLTAEQVGLVRAWIDQGAK